MRIWIGNLTEGYDSVDCFRSNDQEDRDQTIGNRNPISFRKINKNLFSLRVQADTKRFYIGPKIADKSCHINIVNRKS